MTVVARGEHTPRRIPRELRCAWCGDRVIFPRMGMYDRVIYEYEHDGKKRTVQRRARAIKYRCLACRYEEIYLQEDLLGE